MKHVSCVLVVLGFAAGLLGLSTVAGAASDTRPRSETPFAYAQTYFLHLGLAAVPYDESSVTTVGGAIFTGADIRLDTDYTLAAELGYSSPPTLRSRCRAAIRRLKLHGGPAPPPRWAALAR